MFFTVLLCVAWSLEDSGIGLSDPEAVKQHGTVVRPVLDEPIQPGKNVLWCATLQMAWDSAKTTLGGPLDLQPSSPLAAALNRGRFDPGWVDAASVFQAAGTVGDGVLDRIAAGAPGDARSILRGLRNARPDDLVLYAELTKNLEFKTPFAKMGHWEMGKRKVPIFGFRFDQFGPGMHQQVAVHHYACRSDFVIELVTTEVGDQLLLAKIPEPPVTPAAIGAHVNKRLIADAPSADIFDYLVVPNVKIDEKTRFAELENRRVRGQRNFWLKNALQTIDFQMDEKGVKLRSQALMRGGAACTIEPRFDRRYMIVEPPFAIVMKRKNAPQPYFIGWIANADLLAR